MRLRLFVPCVLLALAGCPRKTDDTAALAAQVKQRLAERDTKLGGYHIAGTVKDEGQDEVPFSFDYRAPQRMRGTLGTPATRIFSWDGTHLFEQLDGEKRFTTFKSELPPAKLAGFLTETFGVFTPEGFRAPLVSHGATLRRVKHPRAPEAVELAVTLGGEAQGLELVYVLRWPGLDFLDKRSRAPDGTQAEVRMEEEHCDAALALCVPRRLTRWLGGRKVGETVLSRVELNSPPPNDTFTLTAPEGYDVKTRTLVEATPENPPTGG
ncbi:hypothetical protein HUA74_08490 [Myxococcus sp. CA051A]|uniref:Lipoprotein n=1 Tax=Myxococcus llanfairpwllgwyngyllgogerychwyrndrobwllllantysiliogogogochensis TaxID=2590453 RepID=A0A540WSM0_9BACT|nr:MULTISPECIES: hypothetical protein [Myxococcus]NTX03005.1 hypothetical protein [Myxococcus sp. CA040A]NTX11426.1 hypothetical protein [Myxococcus sp. CA056]NTX34476.1 hypothetical protein [Myxococcus sp. CA033]NTX56681.1 hypothetical protein [Myxococcus sp. CA039A]NTX60696.1 hypothetical protein [Myxococcus sp. CA051A]